MHLIRQLVVAGFGSALPAAVVVAGPAQAARADVEIVYETRSRTPKVAGVLPLTPGLAELPPNQIPTYYRRLEFSGERHEATGPLAVRSTNSQTVEQKRQRVRGSIRYSFNPATDNIEVVNEAMVDVGTVTIPPWPIDAPVWPLPPVLSVDVPFSSSSPVGYDVRLVAANNPLGLVIRGNAWAGDDNVFTSAVGGYNAVAAVEQQLSWRMDLLDEEVSTAEIESRARVTTVSHQTDLANRSSIRETRQPGSLHWFIREVKVSYRLRTPCPGDHILTKTFRERPAGSSALTPWTKTWVETEMITLHSGEDFVRTLDVPLINDREVQLADLAVQPVSSGCSPGSCGDEAAVPGGAQGPTNGSIYWMIPLGRLADGRSAGVIVLHRPSITAEIYSPAALATTLRAGTVLRSSDGILRQLLLPQSLLDLVVLGPQGYEVRCYERAAAGSPGTDGLHRPLGPPYLVWRIENPDPTGATANRLRVTRVAGGESVVTDVDESQPGRRIFSEAGGLRVTETTSPSWTGSRVETVVVRDSAGRAAAKRQRHYTLYPWGEECVKEVLDPDGAALTTEWTFGESPDQPSYRQEIRVRRPEGAVETVTFSSPSSYRRQSPAWNDATQTELQSVTEADLNGDGLADRLTTRVTSVSLSRTSAEWIIDWGTPPAAIHRRRDRYVGISGATDWNFPGNLRTRERFSLDTGELVWREQPDGTLTLRTRTSDPHSGSATVVEETGAPGAAGETVVDGLRTRTVTTATGQLVSVVTTDIVSGRVVQSLHVVEADAFGRPVRLEHLDGAWETRTYCATCSQVASVTLRGETAEFGYDALGRKIEERIRNGTLVSSLRRFRYDAEDRLIQVLRVNPETGGESPLRAIEFDLAGRVIAESSLAEGTTTYSYSFGPLAQTITTATQADGGTRIETRGASGALISLRGTAVAPVDFHFRTREWDGRGEGYVRTIERRNDDGTVATEEQTINLNGEVEAVLYPGNATFRRTFDRSGRVMREEDPDGVALLHAYDARGSRILTAVDLNRNGVIDFSGPDRVVRVRQEVGSREGVTVVREIVERWEEAGRDVPTTVEITETSVDGLRSWATARGRTISAQIDYRSDGRTVIVHSPEGVVTERIFQGPRLAVEVVRDANGGQIRATSYAYDALGRRRTVTDARNGTTTYTHDARDRIVAIASPDPDPARSGEGFDAAISTIGYDDLGRVTTVIGPDGTASHASYYPTGRLRRRWGAQTLPVEFSYDAQGRIKAMTTWRNFAADSGRATTTWTYDAGRGWLVAKRYADGQGPTYDYWPSGRLRRRTWARGVTSSYGYDEAGDLASVSYSDGTPTVSFQADRAGRVSRVSDGAGARTFSYHTSGQLESEEFSAGVLAGASVGRTYDRFGRLEALSSTFGAPLTATTFTYDAASRLQVVRAGPLAAEYAYAADSPHVAALTFSERGVIRLATHRTRDRLERIASTEWVPANGSRRRSDYRYDQAGLRRRQAQPDGGHWSHAYDALGQMTEGTRFHSEGVPTLGLAHAYRFDDVGNRVSTLVNGQESLYAANALNQYTQRTIPGRIDIRGAAAAEAQVIVGDGRRYELAARQGEAYFQSWAVANTATAQSVALDVVAAREAPPPALVGAVRRAAFVARSPEEFSHDPDGNLRQDGRWSYAWDAENRLIRMETTADAAFAGAARQIVEFGYDFHGRRVRKKATRYPPAGLRAEARVFFANETLAGPPVHSTQAGYISAFWPNEPYPGLPADGWSFRSTAVLQVPVSGDWTFAAPVRSDDAMRLYLDDRLVLDAWTYGSPSPRAVVPLAAGRDYALRYEFRDGGGIATPHLAWSGPGVPEQVIPPAAGADLLPEVTETRYLYDGWNLLAEIGPDGTPRRTYTWGLDVSGSMHGAAGVGGLLSVGEPARAAQFVAMDGHGNVAALISADQGAVTATSEYSGFGETVEADGDRAEWNRFRFSTRPADAETGLVYFGHRYYSPALGRWLNRDPMEEDGGLNLYGFAGNAPTAWIDPLGEALYAFDGTNNDGERDTWENPRARNGPTNVKILHDIFVGNRHYAHGVGTRDGILNSFGLAGGLGGRSREENALRSAETYISGGDLIADITGFSRGAAEARDFANRLKRRYPCVRIRWIGLFDTVASFGLGGNDIDLGYKFGIPSGTGRVFHLTAGGERRYFFPLMSIHAGPDLGNPNSRYREIMIPGAAHSDIGGGYRDDRGLANLALVAMWRDGRSQGVPFGPIPAMYLSAAGDLHDSRWRNDKIFEFIFGGPRKRGVYYAP